MKNNLIGISGKIGSGKDLIGSILQYLNESVFNSANRYSFEEYLEETKLESKPNNKYQIKKYADKLKDMVCLLIGCTREQLEDREFKEKELGEEWWYISKPEIDMFIPYTEDNWAAHGDLEENLVMLTPRKLMQLLGTECGREILHPNIWVNALFTDYKAKQEFIGKTNDGNEEWTDDIFPNWIITDVRFPNEAQAIVDRGGIVIRINRLKVGDIVYWDDPEQGLSSGVYKIRNINNEEAWITQQDSMAEAQVLPSELSLFRDPEHPSETALDNWDGFSAVIDNNGTIEELIEKVKQLNLV